MVGVPEHSDLQAVSKDADKETKRAVRAANKEVKDKLAAKVPAKSR